MTCPARDTRFYRGLLPALGQAREAGQGHTEVKYRVILNHCVQRGFATTGDEYNDLIGRFRRAGS